MANELLIAKETFPSCSEFEVEKRVKKYSFLLEMSISLKSTFQGNGKRRERFFSPFLERRERVRETPRAESFFPSLLPSFPFSEFKTGSRDWTSISDYTFLRTRNQKQVVSSAVWGFFFRTSQLFFLSPHL
jgi:hypothetical protein